MPPECGLESEQKMRFIGNLTDGMRVSDVYLCKAKTVSLTKNGKEYANVVLQDKTGQIEAKIWNLNDPAIHDFEAMDYVQVDATVTVFNGGNQMNVHRIRVATEDEYTAEDYFPVSKRDREEMIRELRTLSNSVKDEYMRALLKSFFENEKFMKMFMDHSAAKSVHHGFIGGLAEHTLSVAGMCEKASEHYPYLNRDLLLTGALLHDVGKVKELSLFPANDYTDEGQLLGHITIGAQMVSEVINKIGGFPKVQRNQILHLILSHHGEYEFGSPKKPAIMEAFVLSFIDNMDAKLETMKELLESKAPINEDGWMGFQKLLDTNVRKTV